MKDTSDLLQFHTFQEVRYRFKRTNLDDEYTPTCQKISSADLADSTIYNT